MENQSKDLEKSNSTDNAKIILNRLTEGSSVIKNYPTHEDIVLVLGNTGAGKSTFVQYIAGDNSKLISKAVTNARGKPTGDYIIEDTNNKIGISTINSHTELPERVFDNKTNTAIYDCPGFSDTRDAEHDISGAYFIQKIANSAKAVKLVFVINYSALKTGADKLDFMLLARHATSLVKNIDKFKDGVALIATKANDDKSDDAIITTITTYLETVRDELINKEKPSLEDKNIVQFLKLLVDDQSYKQIGFIRQPKEPGPLSNITAMQNHKKSLETLLDKNIKFVMHDDPRDFGYTISAASKNYVNDLVEEVNNSISSSVDSIAEQAKKYYNDLVQQILGKINSFRDTSTINANTSDAKAFLDKFSKGSNLISKLVEELDNVSTPKELGNKINGTIAALDLNRFTNNISDSTSSILTQGEYLEFLQNFSNETLHTRQWKSSFQNVESDFLKLEKHIQSNVTDAVEQINAKIKSNIENGSDSIKGHYSTQEKTIHDINKLYDVVRLGHETFSLASQDADKSTTPKECIEQITNKVGNLAITDTNLSTAHATLSNTVKYGDYLAYLNTLSRQSSPNSYKCTEGLNDVIKYLDGSQKWYRFLNNLYERLSEYDIQKDTVICQDLASNITQKEDNTKVSEVRLEPFLKQCYPKYKEYSEIKDIILSNPKLNALNKVLDFTLRYKLEQLCNDSKLLLTGHYVKLSDIDKANCSQAKFIEIFALNKVFIDTDLDKTGNKTQIAIIAPTWDIQGIRKITLDGQDAEAHDPPKANDSDNSNIPGTNGLPGKPGGSGGSFLGIGEKFINANGLTISANGGKGGPGQHGGDGADAPNIPQIDKDSLNVDTQYSLQHMQNMYSKQYYTGKCNGFYCEHYISGWNVPYRFTWDLYSAGSVGGNGGVRGVGGNPGNISIIVLSNNVVPINIEQNQGPIGLTNGNGGNGGIGGKNANSLHIEYNGRSLISWFDNLKYTYNNNNTRASSGNNGTAGNNTRGIEEPQQAQSMNRAQVVIDYKNYLISNLPKGCILSFLLEFQKKIGNDTTVKDLSFNIRKRRDIDDANNKQIDNGDHNDDVLVAASTGSTLQPVGYSLVSWFKNSISQLKNLGSIAQIKSWFQQNVKSTEQSKLDIVDNVHQDAISVESSDNMGIEHDLHYKCLSERVYNTLISDNSPLHPIHGNYNFNINGSLILANLIVRMSTGVKYDSHHIFHEDNDKRENMDMEYAHRMMFSAHVPVEDNTDNIELLG